jgi:predicted MFS family arabinose efflux permease
MGMLVPILPAYASRLGAGPGQVGLLLAASAFAGIVLAVPAAAAATRVGPNRLLIASPLLAAPASVLCGLISAFWSLALFCVVEGALAGVYATVGTAFAAAGDSRGRGGRAIALYQGASLLGASLGPAIGGFLGEQSVRTLFLANAVLSLAVAGWLVRRLRPTSREPNYQHQQRITAATWRQFASPGLLALWLLAFAIAFAQFGTQWVTAPFLGARQLELGPRQIGIAMSAGAAIALATFYPAGLLTDRVRRRYVVATGALGTAAALLAFAFVNTYGTFIVAAVALGAASAFTGTAPIVHLGHALADDARTMGVGLYRLSAGLGGALAPILLGQSVERNAYAPALLASAALLLVATGAFVRLSSDENVGEPG